MTCNGAAGQSACGIFKEMHVTAFPALKMKPDIVHAFRKQFYA